MPSKTNKIIEESKKPDTPRGIPEGFDIKLFKPVRLAKSSRSRLSSSPLNPIVKEVEVKPTGCRCIIM